MRKAHSAFRIGALAAAAVLTLTACTTGTSGSESASSGGDRLPGTASASELRDHAINSLKGKTAAFVPVGMGTPLMEEWSRQMKRGFTAAGMKFVLRDPNWDTAKQAEAVQSLINDKPAVLVVHNFDVQILAKLIQQAEQAGIYVVQINMVSNYKSDAFVGADTIDLGRRIATDIVTQCGKDTQTSHKIQIVQGDATSGFTLAGRVRVADAARRVRAHPAGLRRGDGAHHRAGLLDPAGTARSQLRPGTVAGRADPQARRDQAVGAAPFVWARRTARRGRLPAHQPAQQGRRQPARRDLRTAARRPLVRRGARRRPGADHGSG